MKIGVIGGGAAGMTAAITAARQGANVIILEHMPRIGNKLLLTGSGKCNISNRDMGSQHFHSKNKTFIETVFDICPYDEVVSFIESLGIVLKERNGYLYPYSEQASAVLDSFRFALRDLSIEVRNDFTINTIDSKKGKYILSSGKEKLCFDRIIVACGGKSYKKTGSDASLYPIIEKLGHTMIPTLPALTFLNCEEGFYSSLGGIRTKASVELIRRATNESLGRETGELQLTKSGISGIPVFNLSYIAGLSIASGQKISAIIDFLPDFDVDNIIDIVKEKAGNYKTRTLEELFIGIVHKNIGNCIIKRCGYNIHDICSRLSDSDVRRIVAMLKSFSTNIIETGTFDTAQVTCGGVNTREITSNMESKIHKGMYFAGEILDVNGDCGGYNLHWAFMTGIIAGKSCSNDSD